jgi:nucleoside-diphosphate kinase
VVKSARKLIGATNPLEAEPGTIRGDFAVQTGRNVVHGSDSPENGERETGECLLLFPLPQSCQVCSFADK